MKRRLCALLLTCYSLLGVSGCFRLTGNCSDQLLNSAQTTGGVWRAEVIERDCGATTEPSIHIRLQKTIFLLLRSRPRTIAIIESPNPPTIIWRGPEHLQIRITEPVRFFLKEDSFQHVHIEYVNINNREGDA